MSADTASAPEWHTRLAERDRVVHAEIAGAAASEEEAALGERLTALMAELRTARAAVATRDEILREQAAQGQAKQLEPLVQDLSVALTERTEELRQVAADLAAVTATRTWRWSRRAAGAVSAVRRRARR